MIVDVPKVGKGTQSIHDCIFHALDKDFGIDASLGIGVVQSFDHLGIWNDLPSVRSSAQRNGLDIKEVWFQADGSVSMTLVTPPGSKW